MPDEIKSDAVPENEGDVVNDVAEEPQEAAPVADNSQSEDVENAEAENGGGSVDDDPGAENAGDKPEGESIEAGGDAGAADDAAVADDAEAEAEAEAVMQAMLDKGPDEGEESRQDLADEFPDLSHVKMEETMANPAEFQQLNSSPARTTAHNIDLLLDVKMPVSIELGRTDLQISDILSLAPGSVVELDKLAGEPVDLLVNDKIIARGEVVVVDENFGVRITMLMSPEERIKSLA